ncbi:DNA mismatch repair protein Mlh1 [Dichotomocladium elegans]|nr:DNA mismatch repair protein Mlh1 [Dichotomocladium elegans]
MEVPHIRRLEENVVNRIAAGEIILRPANALKELIENSLDAGATTINILIQGGGLRLLQIQDNGHGIRKEDLNILCERFTTSKLKTFDDLQHIGTFGFRGEALASISHVARLRITTKTPDSPCAYKAEYLGGKLKDNPKMSAGNPGTQITVEDLFYDIPIRRKALKSPGDEYNRILNVVSRYAVHNASVSFVCKKKESMTADIQTSMTKNTKDTIRQIYGESVASELLPVEREYPLLRFKMKGYISNANYNYKSFQFLLFVNNRAVENSNIKKAIESVYSPLLPKGSHPFVYLSLEVDPRNVDVNVHPTKREVTLLNEDRITDAIVEILQEHLENANYSRTFYTQQTLTGEILSESSQKPENTARNESKKLADYKMVRTDSRAQTLDTFVQVQPRAPLDSGESSSSIDRMDIDESSQLSSEAKRVAPRKSLIIEGIDKLRKAVKRSENQAMTNILRNHTFVGCVDDTLALIQHDVDLYLINFSEFSEELFYQVVLAEFGNFGTLKLENPICIADSIEVALEVEEARGSLPSNLQSKSEIATSIANALVENAMMLKDHFSLKVSEDGYIIELPMLLRGHIPTMDKLPSFLLRLGTEVDWETKDRCFHSIARELALFYSAEPPLEPVDANEADVQRYKADHKQYLWQVQHLIFPSFKSYFIAPNCLSKPESGFVTRLASIGDLYKIFKRC